MPSSNKPRFTHQIQLHIEHHMAVDLLEAWWHHVVISELEGR
jgi:hypothetical protein